MLNQSAERLGLCDSLLVFWLQHVLSHAAAMNGPNVSWGLRKMINRYNKAEQFANKLQTAFKENGWRPCMILIGSHYRKGAGPLLARLAPL